MWSWVLCIMYTSEQLFGILSRRVAENKPHRDYERTVTHVKWCYQMMTGDDQRDILVTYKVRETEKQMHQRVRITNSRTQYVANKVMRLYNEVNRCDDVNDSISYSDGSADKALTLLTALAKFYEAKPLDSYLSGRFRDLVFYDPNAYVVLEFDNSDPVNRKPTVYPLEFAASEIYDHKYENGVLQYIITQQAVTYPSKDRAKKTTIGQRYTLYGIGYSHVLQHIPKDAAGVEVPMGYTEVRISVIDRNTGKMMPERFFTASFENKTTECQAYRAGYFNDPATNGRTKVSPLFPALKILTDLIWNKSEYDLSKALHGFYQKFQYVSRCEKCQGECEVDGRTCTACKGTGKNTHTTVQDIVQILLPDNLDTATLPPLANFVHYATIPEHLINKQKADYEADQRDVFNAIFGSNVLDRTELVETATAKHYDWRAVNNTLSEYADHRSEAYKFFVRMTASHLMVADGLTVQHSYPADFKLETIQELIDQRASAVNAGAPMAIISKIDAAIMSKQHRDDPDFIARYKAREKFRPMRDKSRDERSILISSLPTSDPERVLYLYFERIMDDVFWEFPQFADMDYGRQKEIVYGKVSEIVASQAAPTMTTVMTQAMTDAVTDPSIEEAAAVNGQPTE